jgi:hypothetical protein
MKSKDYKGMIYNKNAKQIVFVSLFRVFSSKIYEQVK